MLSVGLLGLVRPSHAQPGSALTSPEGVAWSTLTPAQKNALRPLEHDWNSIDASRKAKWLEIAGRFPKMPPAEQARIQDRMNAWTRMSPHERGEARLNYKEAQQVSPQERAQRWEQYNALPADKRRQLADRAAPARRKEPPANSVNGAAQTKSSIVPNTSYAARPRAIAPTMAQAQPGASTNLITKRPTPPAHQQPGLPKIAATPGFVDQATLLPKRGPQGAGARAATAAAPTPAPPPAPPSRP